VDSEGHPPEELSNFKLFKTNADSTIAIKPDGDIIAVSRNKKEKLVKGSDLMDFAVKNGGIKLDSYEGNHRFYRKCGFEPVSWTRFNREIMDEFVKDWKPEFGQEDIIFYKYTGNKAILSRDEVKSELDKFKKSVAPKDYDDAMAERDAAL